MTIISAILKDKNLILIFIFYDGKGLMVLKGFKDMELKRKMAGTIEKTAGPMVLMVLRGAR